MSHSSGLDLWVTKRKSKMFKSNCGLIIVWEFWRCNLLLKVWFPAALKSITFRASNHLIVFISFSAVDDFITKYNPIIPELSELANDSTFGEFDNAQCFFALNRYIELTNSFTKLKGLVSMVNSTRETRSQGELRNISVSVGDFLSRLHTFWVSQNLKVLRSAHTEQKQKTKWKFNPTSQNLVLRELSFDWLELVNLQQTNLPNCLSKWHG